jgi:hypothetical protein
MGNKLIRKGRKFIEYYVCQHAGNHGEATKVRFGPRDRWVGDDYWRFVREYEPARKERAFLLMSRLENAGRQHSLIYWVARAVVLHEMGFTESAGQHISLWRETHDTNDTGIS